MIQIECPGGTSGSCQALYNEILCLKKENPKPVVVYSDNMCASGGYYIACAADYIVSSPSALIGSIGNYVGFFKIKELAEHFRIKYNIRQSGKFKTLSNPLTDITPEMNEFLQSVSDDIYSQFKNDVAARRKLSLKDEDKWANGKFFSGKQALALGLIDEIGSEYNAIKKLRELALIEKDKKIEWVKPKPKSIFAQFLETEEDDDTVQSSLVDSIADKICLKLGLNSGPKAMME
jgi:protease-4